MHGVGPRRLIFAARTDLPQHWARYRVADLALDTFPYTSHTTAMDALWMGCPLVTFSGATFASRVAGSVLTVAGLPQLIAATFDEYIQLVKQLANESGKLKWIREYLRSNNDSSPLFDTSLFVNHLEEAYLKLLDAYLASLQPRNIRIGQIVT
jgi:predicted O-linked N-acetylglucosamine transferase (SPINDLY family)